MAVTTITLDTIELVSVWGAKSRKASIDQEDIYPGVTSRIPVGSRINSATVSMSYHYQSSATIYSVNGSSLAYYDSDVTGLVREAFNRGDNPLFRFRFQSDVRNYPYAGSNTLSVTGFSLTIDYIPSSSEGSLDKDTALADGIDKLTLAIRPYSTAYSHRAIWQFGEAQIAQDVPADTTTAQLVVPLDWCEQLPRATAGQGSVTLETYNGGTRLGTKTFNYRLQVPNTVQPSVKLTVEPVEGFNGLYLQGVTKAKLTADAKGAQGSVIDRYQQSGAGYSGSSNPFETGALMTAGKQTLVCTVTDSRGRQATSEKEISVTPYHRPVIGSLSAVRCLSDGTESGSGTYIKATADYAACAVPGNSIKSSEIKFRKVGDADWISGGQVPTGDSGLIFGNGVILTSESYEGVLTVQDTAGRATTYSFSISPEMAVFEFRHDRAGIGRVAGDAKTLMIPSDWVTNICPYDVNDILPTLNPASPASRWPGTVWEKIESGRFLVAAGGDYAVESKGGEATHTLTVNEIPSHNHPGIWVGSTRIGYKTIAAYDGSAAGVFHVAGNMNLNVGATGGGQPFDNRPPYYAVYMWRRVK